jgi:riboflavin biosynthesis pyrimidine reductase
MQAEATELNIGFMKRMREGLPWVRVKLAMSLDGRTALANGASQWITSEHARNDVQRWRARCSAVMTGVGTVLADDPQLNVRMAGFKGRQPLRVVLDARLRSPVGAKMFIRVGAGGATGADGAAAGSASVPAGPGLAAARTGGAVASAPAATATPLATAALAGDVLIFTAIGGGASAVGAARSGSAAGAGTAALAGDMAELVNAFETSPTSVAARSADLAGPVSVKTEAPAPTAQAVSSSAGDRGAASAAAGLAASNGAGIADGAAGSVGVASGAGVPVGAGGASSTGARASVPAAGAPLTPGAAGAPISSAPPTLAAAAAISGVPTPADDATWAGAALSGAIPVRSDGKAPSAISEPATDGRPPASGGMAPVRAGAGGAPTGNTTSTGNAVPPALLTTPMTPAMGAAGGAGLVGAANPAGPAGPADTAGPQTSASPAVPVSAAPGVSAGSAAASGGVAPPAVASAPATAPAMIAATAQAAGKAPGPGSAGVPAPGAAAKSPAGGSAGRPAAGVAATGATDTRGATSAVAGAAPRDGAPMKVALRADTPAAFQARRAALLARGVRIEEVAADDGFLDLFAVLQKLAELEVNEVLVEAGPTLAGQLFTTFFADELLLYIAPKLLGPQGRPLVNLPELQSLQDAWGFALFDAKRFGDDLRLRMRPK